MFDSRLHLRNKLRSITTRNKMQLTFSINRRFLYTMTAVVGAFLLVLAGFPLFGQLVESWQKLNSLGQTVEKLSVKKDFLANLDAKEVNAAAVAARALPAKMGTLAAVAQVRAAASQKGVNIVRIQVTPKEETSPSATQIKIDIEGPLEQVNEFLKVVEKTLPFIQIGDGRTTKTGGLVETAVVLETYWKEVPKLPEIEEALPELTAKEKEFLTKLSGFKETTSAAIPVAEGQGRANPFSF
ncbi:hypothetical protein HYZ78_02190 [Candidatus Microgenomates bacterium]|nr:hypothetical protein [Candidatus Microgenomates bacterium]